MSTAASFRVKATALAACLSVLPAIAHAQGAVEAGSVPLPEVTVTGTAGRAQAPTDQTGAYTVRRSSTATGIADSLRETPQSVSVITRAVMDDFKLRNVNDLLDAATGVTVEKVETERTYYTARGFDIVNFQVDGIGVPFVSGNVNGDIDTAIYDRVEVVRGATGLLTGEGNPSATINYVRKRPTTTLQASGSLSYGSWDAKRVDADVSGPLNAAGSVRGRLVLAAEDKDSYLDRYHLNKNIFYGVLEADVSDTTLLTLGHSQQTNKPKGSMWGALPLNFTDGTPTHYDTSANSSPAWTYWNNDTALSFAEVKQQLAKGWQATAVVTHREDTARAKLFYFNGRPDPVTGGDIPLAISRYDMKNTQDILDLRVNGGFKLWGLDQELVFGGNASRSKYTEQSIEASAGYPDFTDNLATWNGSFAEPVFDTPGDGGNTSDERRSLYAAVRLNPVKPLKVIVGANALSVITRGVSYGTDMTRDEHNVAPYTGLVLDLGRDWSLYGSYTSIFNPQNQLGSDFQRLKSVKGRNAEMGVKGEFFNKQLNASAAIFKTRQDNLAEYVGDETTADGHLFNIYKGVNTLSQGFEADVEGALGSRVKLNAGYTVLSIKDDSGQKARPYSPRQLLKLSSTVQVIDKLKLGAALSWRASTWRDQGDGAVARQGSYALLNLMARYDISDHFNVDVNVNNVGNKKYLTSLYWDQAYYGAPRNGSVTLNWKY
jgi:outer membrane receptor for ferric coprogen and ferric-rhodotorulic acid